MIDAIIQQHFETALVAVARKNWPAAADAFWLACQRSPNNVNVLFNLANARLHASDRRGAKWAVDRAIGLDPKFPNLQLLAGNVYAELEDFMAAIECYVTAVEQDPQNMIASGNLAAAFEQIGLFEESYECYEFAIALGADRAKIYSAMYYVASHACRWDLTERTQQLMDNHLARGGQNSASPFQMLTMQSTRAQQRQAAEHYARANYGALSA